MALPRIPPHAFRRLTTAVLVASVVIVVTGAAVRLTGSGLGCPTWPNCRGGQLDSSGLGLKGAIEFGNRVITVAITVLVGLTALASLLLPELRRDLRVLAWAMVAGVLGDAVIGGITVLTHLDPVWVAIHFLFSMVLVVVALGLRRRAAALAGAPRPLSGSLTDRTSAGVTALTRGLAGGIVALAGFVLFAGTLATGSGPHAGDSHASRFHFAPLDRVTALHADAAMVLTGLVIAFAVLTRLVPVVPAADALARRATVLLGLVVAQAALGFAQYLLDLPALLVLLHVAGATLLWVAALVAWSATRSRPAEGPALPGAALPREELLLGAG